jgi:hypothetical protein
MSRWWRAYDEAIDDPKLQQLCPKLFKAWFNICCITSQNGGKLPSLSSVAFKLRVKPEKARAILEELKAAGLIDDDMDGDLAPHNWSERQYQSDVSTDRVKRFRKRTRNVSSAVSATPTDTETETEQIQKENKVSDPNGSARDVRADLFNKGLKSLAAMTGKTPDSCRSLLGKWLKSVNDEAIHVLGAIEDAERNRVADPVAWINRALQTHGANNGNRTVHEAALDFSHRLAELGDVPPADRGATSRAPVRLLPPR